MKRMHRAALLTLAAGLLAGQALAADIDNSRTVYHMNKVEAIEVGDVAGHVIGVAEASGLSFEGDGEVAIYTVKFFFDYIDGSGAHQAWGITTFADGSTRTAYAKGTTTAQADGTSKVAGSYRITGGTGRFAKAKGEGTYEGKRVAPLEAGADTYVDMTAQ